MIQKNHSHIYFLTFIWILGILHIFLTGLKPYTHYISGEILRSNLPYILFTCGVFSIFFLFCYIAQLLQLCSKAPFLNHLFLAFILLLQTFYSCLGAMHSPPVWVALIVNNLILIIIFFLIYPFYHHIKKHH